MKTTRGAARTVKRPKRAPALVPDARTVKEIMQNVVNKLPPDCTWDDVMYQVYVCKKIAAGLRDCQEGRLFTEEEVFRDLDQFGYDQDVVEAAIEEGERRWRAFKDGKMKALTIEEVFPNQAGKKGRAKQ